MDKSIKILSCSECKYFTDPTVRCSAPINKLYVTCTSNITTIHPKANTETADYTDVPCDNCESADCDKCDYYRALCGTSNEDTDIDREDECDDCNEENCAGCNLQ